MAPSIGQLYAELLPRLESAPASVTYAELRRFCVAVFGEGRRRAAKDGEAVGVT